jgi:hypothetical protein
MSKRSKIVITCVAVILVVTAVGLYLWSKHHGSRYNAQTTSNSPTAQPDYSGGNERNPNNGGSSSQGGAIDTGGKDVPQTGIGVSSKSGLVTLVEPDKDSQIKNGQVVGGTVVGDIAKVEYRLIDNEVGVLAQGTLNVVNKSFSGKLQFTSRSSAGRLDIYTYDASGSEVNNIELPVTFTQ